MCGGTNVEMKFGFSSSSKRRKSLKNKNGNLKILKLADFDLKFQLRKNKWPKLLTLNPNHFFF